jgi:hypothetical protein
LETAAIDSGTAESKGELAALLAALDHARTMANFASDLRMRNFNFFIVVAGALIAGLAQLPAAWSPVVGIAGAITSVLFLGLDIRGRGLAKRSIDQLVLLEPIVWQRAGVHGWTQIPRHGGSRFLNHQWIYRTFFVIVGLASIVGSALRFALRHVYPVWIIAIFTQVI